VLLIRHYFFLGFEIVVVPVGNYTVQIIKIWVGFGSCLFQSKFDDVKIIIVIHNPLFNISLFILGKVSAQFQLFDNGTANILEFFVLDGVIVKVKSISDISVFPAFGTFLCKV